MKLFLKIVGGLILFFILLVVFILGYLGFIPGLSNLLGAYTPKDLGVRYTEADRKSAIEKHKLTEGPAKSGNEAKMLVKDSGANDISTDATQEEISAIESLYHPVSNLQVRFNSDNSVEVSGLIDRGRLSTYASIIGMPAEDLEIVNQILDKVPGPGPAFYFKSSSYTITNNRLDFNLTGAQLGRMPIPNIGDWTPFLEDYVSERLSSIPNHYIKKEYIENGKLHTEGQFPKSYPKF